MAINKQMHGIVTCLNALLEEDVPQQRVNRYKKYISDTSSDADDALTSIEEWAETILSENRHPYDYQKIIKLIEKESQYSVVWYAMSCLIRAHDVRASIRHGDAASAAALSLELMGAVWQANERKLQDEVEIRRKNRAARLREEQQGLKTEKVPKISPAEQTWAEPLHVLHKPFAKESSVQEKFESCESASKKEISSGTTANAVGGLVVNEQSVSVSTEVHAPASDGIDAQKHAIGLTSASIREKVQFLFQIVKPAHSVEEEDSEPELDFSDTIMEVMETSSIKDTEFTRKYYQQVIDQVYAEYPKYDLDALRQLAANRLEVSKQYLINLDIRPN